jgi:hypothetical protein
MKILELIAPAEVRAEDLEELYLRLDLLHDVAAAGRLPTSTGLSRDELRGWLQELAYITREALRELDRTPYERLVERELI